MHLDPYASLRDPAEGVGVSGEREVGGGTWFGLAHRGGRLDRKQLLVAATKISEVVSQSGDCLVLTGFNIEHSACFDAKTSCATANRKTETRNYEQRLVHRKR